MTFSPKTEINHDVPYRVAEHDIKELSYNKLSYAGHKPVYLYFKNRSSPPIALMWI
jgi:hypothetical protein